MTLDELFTLEKVRAWAAAKPADEVIGLAGSTACPLAVYLDTCEPGHTHFVAYLRIYVDREYIKSPRWADKVSSLVDARRRVHEPITAAEFLAILDAVASEVQP